MTIPPISTNTPFQHDPLSWVHLKETVDKMYFPKYCNLILKKTNAKGPEQPMVWDPF